jgi:hypothetical protein
MRRFRALIAVILIAAGFLSPAWAQSGCVSDAEGRQLLQQGLVLPFPDAMQRAGLNVDRVEGVQLCQGGSGYIYRVQFIRDGQPGSADIPAG